ncbi:MAG: segregation/condensation protein A [Chloroflexi bacterium]|nr:segregation/condensation protein A [Chloroflexota bacterium]
MTYQVQLPLFEGPLDLLLHLIEREELEITAISVAQIADQYLAYLALLQERHAGDLADFLVMAARLLWIKSRALLPRPPQALEEGEEEDPAEALARQLREYKRFKEAAGWLREREASGLRAYVRTAPPPTLPRHIAPGSITLDDLLQALQQTLAATEPVSPSPVDEIVAPITVTIADQIGRIMEATARQGRVRFHQLLAQAVSRVEIIVTLLALLELIKQQRVSVVQLQLFGEIVIAPLAAARPD